MRTAMVLPIGLFACFLNVYCQVVRYAIPVKDEVPVYSNETRKVFEQPLFFVGKNDRLVVQASGKNMIKIESSVRQTGWLESSTVSIVSRNQSISFVETDVPGYIDNPTLINIIGPENSFEQSLNLNRSFADALRENVDRETIARQNGE